MKSFPTAETTTLIPNALARPWLGQPVSTKAETRVLTEADRINARAHWARSFLALTFLWISGASGAILAETKPADYATVHQIFNQHCLDCHAAQEPEAKLVL